MQFTLFDIFISCLAHNMAETCWYCCCRHYCGFVLNNKQFTLPGIACFARKKWECFEISKNWIHKKYSDFLYNRIALMYTLFTLNLDQNFDGKKWVATKWVHSQYCKLFLLLTIYSFLVSYHSFHRWMSAFILHLQTNAFCHH